MAQSSRERNTFRQPASSTAGWWQNIHNVPDSRCRADRRPTPAVLPGKAFWKNKPMLLCSPCDLFLLIKKTKRKRKTIDNRTLGCGCRSSVEIRVGRVLVDRTGSSSTYRLFRNLRRRSGWRNNWIGKVPECILWSTGRLPRCRRIPVGRNKSKFAWTQWQNCVDCCWPACWDTCEPWSPWSELMELLAGRRLALSIAEDPPGGKLTTCRHCRDLECISRNTVPIPCGSWAVVWSRNIAWSGPSDCSQRPRPACKDLMQIWKRINLLQTTEWANC